MKFLKFHFENNLLAEYYVDILLVSAVVTLLAIRFGLAFFGFPELGDGETIHVAHMLWGGITMFAVIIFFLSFLGRQVYFLSAVFGGIGFGIFIDELGKFITVNNDYFFRPAAPLIYFIFITLFFLSRHVIQTKRPTRIDFVANSLEMLQEIYINPHKDAEFRERLAYFLKKMGKRDSLAGRIWELAKQKLILIKRSRVTIFRDQIFELYQKLLGRKLFSVIIILSYVGYLVYNCFIIILPVALLSPGDFLVFSILDWVEIFSAVIVLAATVIALAEFFFSRLAAYSVMLLATYLNLCLLQLFMFYRNQFTGLLGAAVSLVTIFVLKYLVQMEKRRQRRRLLGQ